MVCSAWVCVSVAVWAIISALSIGLLGSWYFISATSSFKKVSDPIWPGRSTVVVADDVAMDDAPLTGLVMGGPLRFRRGRPRRETWIGWRQGPAGCLRYRQSETTVGPDRRTRPVDAGPARPIAG